MSQWVLFKVYDPKGADQRRVFVNLALVERIYESSGGTHFELFTADGRSEKIECTIDDIVLTINAVDLAH
jgi:hypothetical protein